MATISIVVVGLLLCGAALVMAVDEDKHWPDFSCHPYNETYVRRNTVSYNSMRWNSCREPYEKWNGLCHKICVLLKRKVISRKERTSDSPLAFNVGAFITNFQMELGYDEDSSPPRTVQDLTNKIKSEVEACLLKHPEYSGLINLKNTPCEPWANFTQCIDKAVVGGCK